ncbi:MAG TPA: hypothetical protein VD973_10135 [Symbiobacteriaceae bacterium]|nr:hypothetical protein [Symbiobacteriaceae bacterium]
MLRASQVRRSLIFSSNEMAPSEAMTVVRMGLPGMPMVRTVSSKRVSRDEKAACHSLHPSGCHHLYILLRFQ